MDFDLSDFTSEGFSLRETSNQSSTLSEAIEKYLSTKDANKLSKYLKEVNLKSEPEFTTGNDLHLNSPLLSSDPLDYLLDHRNIACFHHGNLKRHIIKLNYKPDNVITDITYITRDLYNYFYRLFHSEKHKYSFERLHNQSLRLLNISYHHWFRVPNNNEYECRRYKDTLEQAFKLMSLSSDFKQKWLSKVRGQKEVVVINKDLELIGNYFILKKDHLHFWCLNINYLLMILDLFTIHFNILYYSVLWDTTKIRKVPLTPVTMEVLEFFKGVIFKLGNTGYGVLASWESLIIGMIIDNNDPELENQLLKTSLADIKSELPEFESMPIFLILKRLVNSIHGQKIMLNIAGIYKCWGHPTINPKEGIEELKSLTRKKKKLNPDTLKSVRASWRKTFCKSFFDKKGFFPKINMDFPGMIHPNIHYVIKNRRWFNEHAEPKMSTDDWLSFEFCQNFTYDYTEDLERIVSDKAIAPPLTDWSQDYCKCAFKRSGQERPHFEQSTRRLLVKLVTLTEDYDVKGLFQTINDRNLPRENYRIKLTNKELEMKIKGRNFSSQTFPVRIWQTISEKNIANNIFPFIPHQSMTIGELKTEQRITAMSSIQKMSRNNDLHFANFDMKKWNMSFRWETCYGIARDMDLLQGLPSNNTIFSHEFFEQCYFTYPSSIAPAYGKNMLPKEGHGCHIGQPGGCEGLRQKLWTEVTAEAIIMAAESLGIQMSLICQGDNQAMLVRIPNNDKELLKVLLNTIEMKLNEIGLELKRSETWVSRSLVTYSKHYYLNGVGVDDSLKPVMRLMGEQNSDYPCLTNELGTISTGGESIAKGSDNPCPAFMLASLHHSFKLQQTFQDITELESISLCLMSPLVGGFPISQFSNYCVRGTPDPLTDICSRYQFVQQKDPQVWSCLRQFLNIRYSTKGNLINIIKDPHSLNLTLPITPVVGLSLLVSDFVRDIITTPRYRKLIEECTEEKRDIFKKYLVSADHLYPVLLNNIYSVSTYGILEQLESRFDNTSSLIKIISNRYGTNEVKKSINLFVTTFHKSLLTRGRIKVSSETRFLSVIESNECSYVKAKTLRNESWNTNIIGVTMPCPADQIMLIPWKNLKPNEIGWTITAKLSDRCQDSQDAPFEELGPFAPYLGSETHEKIKIDKKPNKAPRLDGQLERARKIFVWLKRGLGPNAQNLLKTLIRARLDTEDIEELEKVMNMEDVTVYGGSPTHRMCALGTNPGCFLNQKSCPASHIQYSSSGSYEINRGSTNRVIYFQHLYTSTTSILTEYMSRGLICCPSYGLFLHCEDCREPIEEEAFDFPQTFEEYLVSDTVKVQIIPDDDETVYIPGDMFLSGEEALAYYLALKMRTELDSGMRTSSGQKTLLHILNSMKPTFNYGKTETGSVNILLAFQYLRDVMPGLYDYINFLHDIVDSNIETLLLTSSWIPLQGLAQAMIGTDRVSLMMRELHVRNTTFNAVLKPTQLTVLIYRCIRNSFKLPQIEHPVLHSNEQTFFFMKRIFSYYRRFKWAENEVLQEIPLSSPELCRKFVADHHEEIKKYINIVATPESCLVHWRELKTHYSGLIHMSPRLELKICRMISQVISFATGDQTPCDLTNLGSELSWTTETHAGYVHATRTVGGMTTAPSKLIPILSEIENLGFDPTGGNILCCADGAGGITSLMLHRYDSSYVFYNTLLTDSDFPLGNPDCYMVPELIGDSHSYEDRLMHLSKMTLCETNIFKKGFDKLLDLFDTRFQLITMDAEDTHGGITIEHLKSWFKLADKYLDTKGFLVMKVLIGEDYLQLFNLLKQYCNSVIFCKPETSNPSLSEVYLIVERKNLYYSERTSTVGTCRDIMDFQRRITSIPQPDFSSLKDRYTTEYGYYKTYCPCLNLLQKEFANWNIDIYYHNLLDLFFLESQNAVSKITIIANEFSLQNQLSNAVVGTIRNHRMSMIMKHLKSVYMFGFINHLSSMNSLENIINSLQLTRICVYVLFDPSTLIVSVSREREFRKVVLYSFEGSVENFMGRSFKTLIRFIIFFHFNKFKLSRNIFYENNTIIKLLSNTLGVDRSASVHYIKSLHNDLLHLIF